jgi:hypothetical protein
LIAALDEGRWSYEDLVQRMAAAERIAATLPSRWNDLERYQEGHTALIHFTDMNTQPWLSTENLHGHLWCRDLLEALDAKFIELDLVRDHVRQGWIRPSLLYQIEHRILDPLLLPAAVRDGDERFVPPHRRARVARGGGPRNAARRLYALTRHLFTASGGKRLMTRVRRRLSRIRARL